MSRLVKRVSAAFSRFVHFSDQMQYLKLLLVHITQLAGGEMVEDHCVRGRASMPKPFHDLTDEQPASRRFGDRATPVNQSMP